MKSYEDLHGNFCKQNFTLYKNGDERIRRLGKVCERRQTIAFQNY